MENQCPGLLMPFALLALLSNPIRTLNARIRNICCCPFVRCCNLLLLFLCLVCVVRFFLLVFYFCRPRTTLRLSARARRTIMYKSVTWSKDLADLTLFWPIDGWRGASPSAPPFRMCDPVCVWHAARECGWEKPIAVAGISAHPQAALQS